MYHNGRSQAGLRALLFLIACSILFPVLLIALWAVARRWPWPALLPDGFSARGLAELFGGHSHVLPLLTSSVMFSLLAAFLAVIVGYLSARAFVLYEFPGKGVLKFGSILPVLIPANVFAMGIHVLFIRWGLADRISGVLLCHVLYALPYTINILLDSMEPLGAAYEHQAVVLGCPPHKAFLFVTMPLLLPALLSALSMAYIISFSQYFLTLLIGGGRVKTFSMVMVPFIAGGDRTIASAYVLMFLLSSILVFVLFEVLAQKLVYGQKE